MSQVWESKNENQEGILIEQTVQLVLAFADLFLAFASLSFTKQRIPSNNNSLLKWIVVVTVVVVVVIKWLPL